MRRDDNVVGFLALKAAWGIESRSYPWSVWELPNMWEADHAIPLAEGGTHDLANYRTLCIPCHRKATAALARRRSKKGRQESMSL